MGDGADAELARQYPEVFGEERRGRRRTGFPTFGDGDWIRYYQQDRVWRTAEGEEIPLTDLEQSHRANIIRYMEQRGALVRELLISQAENLQPDEASEAALEIIHGVTSDRELVHRLPLIRALIELERSWRQQEIL